MQEQAAKCQEEQWEQEAPARGRQQERAPARSSITPPQLVVAVTAVALVVAVTVVILVVTLVVSRGRYRA